VNVALVIEDAKWRGRRRIAARLRKAAEAALAHEGAKDAALTLLLAGDEKLRALNRAFRGKDRPTNVLSFPAGAPDYLGDIALAYGVTAKEAREQRTSFADHAAHLVVHGVLHLLGYDHQTGRDARMMEPLEAKILAGLGVRDPYARDAR
jgi:probable rRNA maturation factor